MARTSNQILFERFILFFIFGWLWHVFAKFLPQTLQKPVQCLATRRKISFSIFVFGLGFFLDFHQRTVTSFSSRYYVSWNFILWWECHRSSVLLGRWFQPIWQFLQSIT